MGAADEAAALGTAVSLLHWWGLDPHLDEQLYVMLTDLDLHCLSPAVDPVCTLSEAAVAFMGGADCVSRYMVGSRSPPDCACSVFLAG